MVYDFCFEKSYPAISDNTMKDCIYQFARYNKLTEQLFSQYVRSQAKNRSAQAANSWFTSTLFEDRLKAQAIFAKIGKHLDRVNCFGFLQVLNSFYFCKIIIDS